MNLLWIDQPKALGASIKLDVMTDGGNTDMGLAFNLHACGGDSTFDFLLNSTLVRYFLACYCESW